MTELVPELEQDDSLHVECARFRLEGIIDASDEVIVDIIEVDCPCLSFDCFLASDCTGVLSLRFLVNCDSILIVFLTCRCKGFVSLISNVPSSIE